MRKLLFVLSLLASLSLNAQEGLNWLTDMEVAKKEAAASQKNILVSFSGSDWCGNCIRLDKDLFQSAAFQEYAKEHLVLLKLDFPAKKANQLSPAQTEHNEKWAEVFNKNGTFPLTLVVDKHAKQVGVMKYPSSSVEAYIASLKSLVK